MIIKINQVLQLCVVPPTHEAWSRVGTVQRRKSTFGKCKRLLPRQSFSKKKRENIAIFVNAVSGHSLLWLKLFLHLPYYLFIFRSQVSQSLKGYLLSLWGELKTLQTLFLLGSRVEICRRLCFCNSSKSFCCAQVPSCLVRMASIHNHQNDCNHVWGKG